MSQWTPRNIQKRLLKYILEQLSLFSEIDMADLDVSLGTNSKVSLRNLQLDIDKLSVPGLYVRSGTIDTLDLTLTVSDGVNLAASGIHITVTPSPGKKASDTGFSLSRSTADLAKSTTFEDYVDNDLDDDQFMASLEESIIKKRKEEPNTSVDDGYKLNSVMAKAVEYALSKLQIELQDITVTVVSDPSIVDVHLDKVQFSSDGDSKQVQVSGVELHNVKPDIYCGEGIDRAPQSQEAPETIPEEDDDSDGMDEMMSTSFLAETREDISRSIMENASNMRSDAFMSARTEFYDAESRASMASLGQQAAAPEKINIAYIDTIKGSFHGLQPVEDINIDVGTVKIAAAPVPEMLSSLLRAITSLRKLAVASQSAASNLGKPEQKTTDNPTLIQSATLGELQISLTSALLSGGQFAIPASPTLIACNMGIEQRNVHFFSGTVDTICLKRDGSNLLQFAKAGPNLRFELDSSHWFFIFTSLVSLSLDRDLFMAFYGLYDRLRPAFPQFDAITRQPQKHLARTHPKPLQKTSFTVQTAGISVKYDSGELVVSPLTYDSSEGKLSLDSVVFTYEDGSLQIENIDGHSCSKRIRGFDNNTLKERSFTTSYEATVDIISLDVEYTTLKKLGKIWASLQEDLTPPTITKPLHRVRMAASSILMGHNQTLDLSFFLKRIDAKIHNVQSQFGDLEIFSSDLGGYKMRNGTWDIYSMGLRVIRRSAGLVEPFMDVANPQDTDSPLVFVRYKDSTTIQFRNLSIGYYGLWLTFLEDKQEETQASYSRREITVLASDIAVRLVPVHLQCEAALVVKKGNFDVVLRNNQINTQLSLSLISLFLIDDRKNILSSPKIKKGWTLDSIMEGRGYVKVGSCNNMFGRCDVHPNDYLTSKYKPDVRVKIDLDLLKLALCADSSQCLVQLVKDLKEPIVFTFDERYKTKQMESIDIYSEVEEDFFGKNCMSEESPEESDNISAESLHIVEGFYDKAQESATLGSSQETATEQMGSLDIQSDVSTDGVQVIPLLLVVSVEQTEIHLHDGYDWKETRLQISDALTDIQDRAQTTESEGLVEETLFQSVHLGVHPGGVIPYDQINQEIDAEMQSSDEAPTTTISLGSKKPSKKLRLERSKDHKVSIELEDLQVCNLVVSDVAPTSTTTNSELVGRLQVRVGDLKILDNLPRSSWNMFFGYLRGNGDRELGAKMVKLDLDTVRPVGTKAATEMIMDVSVLPVRLHVDQDTLDFLTRFTEFRDARFVPAFLDEDVFLQRVHIDRVPLVLDYKPKKVDYAGLRSGHTSEFMNFFILDEASMDLREANVRGVLGFPRLNAILHDYWLEDIKQKQLGGVLAGVGAVKPLVKLGGGVKDLFVVPVQEYQKDGRVFRGIQKGASTFGKTTGEEILRLGVKLAAGTQTILENTEQMLGGEGSARRLNGDKIPGTAAKRRVSHGSIDSYEDDEGGYRRYYLQRTAVPEIDEEVLSGGEDDSDMEVEVEEEEEKKRVLSLYSDQPKNLNEGLHTAYESFGRNIQVAKETLVGATNRASESGTAQGAAMEFARATPVMLIRPLIGTTEAISRALLGGLNDLDPEESKRAEEKYKK